MKTTTSDSRVPKEWLIVHHELKDDFKRLIIQHLFEPAFMAEVVDKGNEECHVEFFREVSDGVLKLTEKMQNHWKNKAIGQFRSLVEKQFKPKS